MKHIIRRKQTKPSTQSYKETMQSYYSSLKNDSASNFITSRLLQDIDGVLNRCMLLKSPDRERAFVEEVCRMGRRRLHLAA